MRYIQYYVRDDKFEVYDKYVMIGFIGYGVYGDVCVFINKEIGEKVVIKKIGNVFQNYIIVRCIFREILLFWYIEYDNIIFIRDIIVFVNIEDFEDVYIVNEFMDIDFYQIVRLIKFDEYYCQFLFYQLLRGFKYIYFVNILYCDLKFSNFFINCNDCLFKICDFGLV